MELYIAESDFTPISVLNGCQSIIWAERYCECGDFEIYVPASAAMLELLKTDRFVYRTDSDTVMVIEKISITPDPENGDFIVCSGRSAESLLMRRIIRSPNFFFSENTEEYIRNAVNKNVISPSEEERRIPLITLGDRCGVLSTVKGWHTGENLLTFIADSCNESELGFRLRKSEPVLSEGVKLKFELYKGVDRSESQAENPFVIFSPEFDNLQISEYLEDVSELATSAYVRGQNENIYVNAEVTAKAKSGIERREIYVDAGEIVNETDTPLSTAEFYDLIKGKGFEALSECGRTISFSGTIDSASMYKYREDYNVGDVVTVRGSFGINTDVRLSEITECEDISGLSVTVTFSKETKTAW